MATAQLNIWNSADLEKLWKMIQRKEAYNLRCATKYGKPKATSHYRLYRTSKPDVFVWDVDNTATKYKDLIDLELIDQRWFDEEGKVTTAPLEALA